MLRIAGVFMALLLALFGYAIDNVPDSARVDTPSNVEQSSYGNRDEKKSNENQDNGNIREPVSGEETSEGVSYTDRVTAYGTAVIAAFTIILAIVSIFQWCAIKKANEATKRSVDSYIGRERGRLMGGSKNLLTT